MYKLALLGLFITQAALADYSCFNGYMGDTKLLIKNIHQPTIHVEKIKSGVTEKFEGTLTERGGDLYKYSKYALLDSRMQAAELTLTTVRRGCGRGCQKSLGNTVTAELVKNNSKTYYDCTYTIP